MTQTLQETKTCPWMDPPIHVGKTLFSFGDKDQIQGSPNLRKQTGGGGWRTMETVLALLETAVE